MILLFNIDNQCISAANSRYVVSDSREYLKAKFNFTIDWDECVKTAIFSGKDGTYEVLLQNDECMVPYEVLNGCFGVSVFGVDDIQRITTDIAYVSVQQSGAVEGEIPSDPTPTIYEQLLNAIEGNANDVETAISKEEEARKAADEKLQEDKADRTELGGYYTKTETDDKISEASANINTQLWFIQEDIINKADKTELDTKLDKGTTITTSESTSELMSLLEDMSDFNENDKSQLLQDVSDLNHNLTEAEIEITVLEESLHNKADVTSITTPSGTTPTVTLADNTESRCGAVTALTLTLPSDTSGDYISSVIFTANSPTPLVYPDNITMIGTDCIDGVFAPVSGKRYTVIVAYDGAGLVGTVGGYAI